MFYAFVHKYGPEIRDTQGKLIGHVAVFAAKWTRDDFVSEYGNAEAISGKVARGYLIDELLAERPRLRDDAPFLSMAELVNEVRALRSENRGC